MLTPVEMAGISLGVIYILLIISSEIRQWLTFYRRPQ